MRIIPGIQTSITVTSKVGFGHLKFSTSDPVVVHPSRNYRVHGVGDASVLFENDNERLTIRIAGEPMLKWDANEHGKGTERYLSKYSIYSMRYQTDVN
ncbi:hypothetical protein AHIS2_p007 [Acaryochloris phage A-HIS2]|nr:hypothetical protein AHIS2_p007 [Acaryochloris phage A-HIS2]